LPGAGEQVEILADRQQAALRALRARELIVLRPADRAEQDRIRRARLDLRFRRVGFAGGVHRAAAKQRVIQLDVQAMPRAQRFEHGHGLPHNLRADTVAGEHQNFSSHQISRYKNRRIEQD
jgi:hypothetical protein